MRSLTFTLLLLASAIFPAFAQHTFSIVAVDTITGEVGSAGASCLDDNLFPGSNGAIIISDILPGKGAIHTQAYYHAGNQANARLKMEEGLSPAEIVQWLKTHDAGNVFSGSNRQYGIVDFDSLGQPRSAAHTGNFTMDWKGHITGATYSIQGNILLGPQILDSMEARFLNTTGSLADRLMAALQGANVPGADTRCLNNGTSSLSAFLRVAKPENSDDSLYLDLNVPSLPATQEPIDSLQTLYDAWKLTPVHEAQPVRVALYPNPARGQLLVQLDGPAGQATFYTLTGRIAATLPLVPGQNQLTPQLNPGLYLVRVTSGNRTALAQKLVWE
jgi:uncharacterized Ntn-hydrolase superfamily protein